MKNQHDTKNFHNPVHPQVAASIFYVDIKFNSPSIIWNTVYFKFIDKTIDNVRFIKPNGLTAIGEHPAAKYIIDQSNNEPSLIRNIKIMTSVTFI